MICGHFDFHISQRSSNIVPQLHHQTKNLSPSRVSQEVLKSDTLNPKMAALWNLITTFISLVAISSSSVQAWQSFRPFNDAQTLNPYYGDSYQVLEHLGRIVALRTTVSNHEAFPCTFNIQVRGKETEVSFEPCHYSVTQVSSDSRRFPSFVFSLLAYEINQLLSRSVAITCFHWKGWPRAVSIRIFAQLSWWPAS